MCIVTLALRARTYAVMHGLDDHMCVPCCIFAHSVWPTKRRCLDCPTACRPWVCQTVTSLVSRHSSAHQSNLHNFCSQPFDYLLLCHRGYDMNLITMVAIVIISDMLYEIIGCEIYQMHACALAVFTHNLFGRRSTFYGHCCSVALHNAVTVSLCIVRAISKVSIFLHLRLYNGQLFSYTLDWNLN